MEYSQACGGHMSFQQRALSLPSLGIGVSTEYGAFRQAGSLDIHRLRTQYPQYANFLEVGVEITKGLDDDALRWASNGQPTTYHFLDINLDEPDDMNGFWLEETQRLLSLLKPAWICGDAGLWHIGPRESGSMLLLPPVTSPDAVDPMADGIRRLREATGLEVFPENPPGSIFLGSLHLMDFYGRVLEAADTGMVLDCAHLAIYQRLKGHSTLTGLDHFPLDRVVEMHVAGAQLHDVEGLTLVEDNHTPNVLPETWEIMEWVIPRAPNLKAVVFECERNSLEDNLSGFRRIESLFHPEETQTEVEKKP